MAGSLVRQGRSLVAFGSTLTNIAAGATATINVPVSEAGILGRMVVAAGANLQNLTIDRIELNNDLLQSGASTSGELWGATSFYNSAFAIPVAVNDRLNITITNTGAAAAATVVSFTAA